MGEADPALFSTGTDEHGLKIQKVAAAQNKHPSVLCDEVSSKFKVAPSTRTMRQGVMPCVIFVVGLTIPRWTVLPLHMVLPYSRSHDCLSHNYDPS